MKKNSLLIFNSVELISSIILYYIVGNKSIFIYVFSLSLYNIFLSCFSHISIKECLKNIKTTKSKNKIFKYLSSMIIIISFFFLLLSIAFSDVISIFLKIDNTLPVFILMGICICTRPIIVIASEYLEHMTNNSNYELLPCIYDIIDKVLLLIMAIIVFRVLKTPILPLLYLSKIFSFTIIILLLYITHNVRKNYHYVPLEDKVKYKKIVSQTLKNNSHISIIAIAKNSYYYISIFILYLILSTRYHYQITEVEKIITFTYFYAFAIINYLIYLVKVVSEKLPKDISIIDRLYYTFKIILRIVIIFSFISPLTCQLLFTDSSKSIYMVMVNFMAIFILLYDITYEHIKNKKIIYISLISGLIMKIGLIIPLINAFYRMGYNLVYGDVLSTIIAMFTSVLINYIYLRNNSNSEKYFEKILNILYDNIILAIILIILQFVIPMKANNYLEIIGILLIYLIVSIVYIKLKNKK